MCKEHLGSWDGTLLELTRAVRTLQPFQLSATGFSECGRWQPLKMTSLLWLSLVPQAPWLEMAKKHLVVWSVLLFFYGGEHLISPYRNLGSLYKNGKISYLAASSPTNVFWRLLTTFPCAINVSSNLWFLGEQKTNLRWKYYFQRFCCSCYVDFLQISLCTCGEGLQKLAMNWIAQWSKESCVYAETVSVAVITRITKQTGGFILKCKWH